MSNEPPPIYPRHVMCFLGEGLDFDHLSKVAAEVGGPEFTLDDEYSQDEADERMPHAFKASLTTASFTEDDWAAVAQHDSVAYLVSPPMRPSTEVEVSRRMLTVTGAMLRSGATAAKNESSGLAHGRSRWLDLADLAADESNDSLLEAVYIAWVKRPVFDGEVLYSCGMHLLGEADVELCDAELADPDRLEERVELMDAFAIYLLTEERAMELADGAGFRQGPEERRWELSHRQDERHDIDDIAFNLDGYWRLSPDDA